MINHFSRIIEPIQSSIQQYYTFFEFCKAVVAAQPHYHKNCKLIPLKIFDLVHNRIIAKEKRRPQKEKKHNQKQRRTSQSFWGDFCLCCCLVLPARTTIQHTLLVYFSSVLSSKPVIKYRIHMMQGKNVKMHI